jgi:hypothetical protein
VLRTAQFISVSELLGIVHSASSPAQRFLLVFKFFCDESHDSAPKGGEPSSYLVGGFFGNQEAWTRVESKWKRRNELEGIPRYHAAHLNAGTYEYEGWSKARRLTYSKEMLAILKRQGRKLHGVSCGIFVDSFRRIISQSGQEKMGHPYLVCFKTVVAAIAKMMDEGDFSEADRFAVVLDRGDHDIAAVETFYEMKDNGTFKHRHRLETCTPGDSADFVGLQAADFVAYENFRIMHGKRHGQNQMRAAMNSILSTTGFMGYLMGEDSLEHMKEGVDSSICEPGGLVIVPPDRTADSHPVATRWN